MSGSVLPVVLIQSVAWASGLMPLLTVALLAYAGRQPALPWWLMAWGFAVSWFADTAGFLTSIPFISQVYLPLQAALFVLALARTGYIEWLIGAMLGIAATSIAVRHAQGLDLWLHVSAWGMIALLALRTDAPLRTILAAGFLGEIVAWWLLVATHDYHAWLAMQEIRILVTVLWCWCAVSRRKPA